MYTSDDADRIVRRTSDARPYGRASVPDEPQRRPLAVRLLRRRNRASGTLERKHLQNREIYSKINQLRLYFRQNLHYGRTHI